jgi:hypothetical protein
MLPGKNGMTKTRKSQPRRRISKAREPFNTTAFEMSVYPAFEMLETPLYAARTAADRHGEKQALREMVNVATASALTWLHAVRRASECLAVLDTPVVEAKKARNTDAR